MSSPQSVPATLILVGSEAGDGGARARARCVGLLLCSVASTTLLGAGVGHKLLEQKL